MHISDQLHAFEADIAKKSRPFRRMMERGNAKGAAALVAGFAPVLAGLSSSKAAAAETTQNAAKELAGAIEATEAACEVGTDAAISAYAKLVTLLPETHRIAALVQDDGSGGRGGDTPDGLGGLVERTLAILGVN